MNWSTRLFQDTRAGTDSIDFLLLFSKVVSNPVQFCQKLILSKVLERKKNRLFESGILIQTVFTEFLYSSYCSSWDNSLAVTLPPDKTTVILSGPAWLFKSGILLCRSAASPAQPESSTLRPFSNSILQVDLSSSSVTSRIPPLTYCLQILYALVPSKFYTYAAKKALVSRYLGLPANGGARPVAIDLEFG